MTDFQKYISALRKCAKEHENDRTSTFNIRVSDLCRDTARLLEELEQEPETDGWHDSEDPPSDDRYVLLSFSNFSLPINGRYEEDEDGGGNYYIGDDTETALSQDIIVNGWMELPKCRRD